MNELFAPNLFSIDSVRDIILSSYMNNYIAFFILLLTGFLTISYLTGWLLGGLPIIRKIFHLSTLLTLIIITPLIFIATMIAMDIDNSKIMLHDFLFVSLFTSIALCFFVYAGINELKNKEYKLFIFIIDYRISIVVIMLGSLFYYSNYAKKNIEWAKSEIYHHIKKELRLARNHADVRLSDYVVNYFIKSTNGYIDSLRNREENIINNFENQLENYNDNYLNLLAKIDESNKQIESLENKYQSKIDQVDLDIDEEKKRLKLIRKEWTNAIENDMNKLNELAKNSKQELTKLKNQTVLIDNLQRDLNSTKNDFSNLSLNILKLDQELKINSTKINSNESKFEKLDSIEKKITELKSIEKNVNENNEKLNALTISITNIDEKILQIESKETEDSNNTKVVKK